MKLLGPPQRRPDGWPKPSEKTPLVDLCSKGWVINPSETHEFSAM